MDASIRAAEVADIDRFLREEKWLSGLPPVWQQGSRPSELVACWNVKDSGGTVRSQFRFQCNKRWRGHSGFSLLFDGKPIWYVHLEKDDQRSHRNPPWAAQVEGLEPIVRGSHEHAWPDNREFLLRTPKTWELQARRHLLPQIRRLPQALFWFAVRIRLFIEHDQRGFDVPRQEEIFDA